MRITYLFLIVCTLLFVGCKDDLVENSAQLDSFELQSRTDCGCTVTIEVENTPEFCALRAVPGKGCQGNISYDWNTGHSVAYISVITDAIFCVEITDANGCTAEACVNLEDCEENCDTEDCELDIEVSDCVATANVTGCDVRSYEWTYPAGGTVISQGVTVSVDGLYCVLVTLMDGCTLSQCVNINDCEVDPDCDITASITAQSNTDDCCSYNITALNHGGCAYRIVTSRGFDKTFPAGSAGTTFSLKACCVDGEAVPESYQIYEICSGVEVLCIDEQVVYSECEETCAQHESFEIDFDEPVYHICDLTNNNVDILVRTPAQFLLQCNECCEDIDPNPITIFYTRNVYLNGVLFDSFDTFYGGLENCNNNVDNEYGKGFQCQDLIAGENTFQLGYVVTNITSECGFDNLELPMAETFSDIYTFEFSDCCD